jgi:hypothetical protein
MPYIGSQGDKENRPTGQVILAAKDIRATGRVILKAAKNIRATGQVIRRLAALAVSFRSSNRAIEATLRNVRIHRIAVTLPSRESCRNPARRVRARLSTPPSRESLTKSVRTDPRAAIASG